MKIEVIKEGLFEDDLNGLILSIVSFYEYEPKIESDAIVLAFYAKHLEAAEDLSIFIEKSAIEEVLDTEVSSAPDEDGDYLIFVELSKDVDAKKIMAIIDLCDHLCDIENWKFQGYKLPRIYDLNLKSVSMYLAAIKSGKLS